MRAAQGSNPAAASDFSRGRLLPRFRKHLVCSHPVSLGSFSEAQHLVPPELLPRRFADLSQKVRRRHPGRGPAHRHWWAQEGSLFAALPRRYWAFWHRRHGTECQVRLPLSLDLDSGAPARARVTSGQRCERAVWREQWEAGQAQVGDGYYGGYYRAFAEMDQREIAFVLRVRDQSVVRVEEELPLSEADRQAGVVRSAWVRLVWGATPKSLLRLVTHLGPEELSAGEVALRYRQRWQIELFFRWLKGTLDGRHWLAESAAGVAIQVHLALIAVLLLLLGGGGRPTRREWEHLQFHLLGWASSEEVAAVREREQRRRAQRQKA